MTAIVSIIVPAYNEATTIGLLIEALSRQDADLNDVEVIIADGMSQDGTPNAAREAAARFPGLSLRVVENPDRNIPAGLNRAIGSANGQYLIRLDAHSVPAPDYVRRCLETLLSTGAANVGGRWEILPSSSGSMARAIAEAGAHPLGAGDARYRTGGRAGPVDTVPFGAFPRAWIDRVGWYDETLLANEDYELNLRLRRAGGVVWFNPEIRSEYYARSTLASLGRQYARYGFWKGRMLLRYPGSVRWRQALPPLFVLAAVSLATLSIWVSGARPWLALQWATYALALVGSGLQRAARRGDANLAWGLPAALATIHWAWGVSFWWGILTGIFGRGVERASP